MRKISLCITNYNRTEMLIEAFKNVIDDDRISEVIICDDHSNEATVAWLKSVILPYHEKIRLALHTQNVGMSRNKFRSVGYAANDWCIVFDSDNVLTKEYVDALYAVNWEPEIIYCPSFARPQFDYREFLSLKFDRKSVKRYINKRMFECLLNTCNYFVNAKQYMEVFEHNPEMKGTDTIWFNYLWLKAGYSFYVVPGMQYDHRVHEGSGFMEDLNYNMDKAKEIKRKILAL